MLRLQERGGHC